MQEELLHFAWRLKRFDLSDLRTTDGQSVEILHFGEANRHAGPDFTNARVRIGDTLWAGNIEMHLKSSDWLVHRHQHDRAYDNVILHVVLEEDQPIYRSGGERIPCIELRQRISRRIAGTYRQLLHNEYWIPCQHRFFSVSEMVKRLWIDRLLVERLEKRTEAFDQLLVANGQDWEVTFYQALVRNFGVKANTDAFEQLARSIPLKILQQHRGQLLQLEALLFGQAGLLEVEFADEYPQKLQKEYRFLSKKYGLNPMPGSQWKFLRMRPAGFPTVRIAQLAMLLHKSVHLFSKTLAAKNIAEIENMFELQVSHYWHTHYVFDRPSISRIKTLGKTTIHLFIINTIAPFLFLYGAQRAAPAIQDRALRLLEEVPAESNHIIRRWQALGVQVQSAYDTQAWLQLKNNYCRKKRCLDCAIGNSILCS